MNLRRLQYFVVVAEEGNVGRAARRLRMSQPPLSQRVRELESDMGCALFVCSATGMRLTAAGEVLLEEARGLLGSVERIRSRVLAAAGDTALRIGVLGPGQMSVSAGIAREFAHRHPAVAVRLCEGDFGDPTLGVARGQVDVALTVAPFDETGLRLWTLRTDPLFAAVPAQDPLARRDRLSLNDIRGARSIRLPDLVDPLWRAFWQPGETPAGPVVRSVDECLHAVLWHDAPIASIPMCVAPPRPEPLASRSRRHVPWPPRCVRAERPRTACSPCACTTKRRLPNAEICCVKE